MTGHWTGNHYKWEGKGPNAPHITRYFLARGWIMPGETVLDAACCTGYGSEMLAQFAKKVIGLEIDEGAIEDAKSRKLKNCKFMVADLDTCELPDVDVAVSIETVEHLNDMKHFINQLKKHVSRCFIICVPLGGTSQAYKNEKPTPGTEKNDFFKEGDLDNLVIDDTWKLFNGFQYGYSYFAIYYKRSPINEKA